MFLAWCPEADHGGRGFSLPWRTLRYIIRAAKAWWEALRSPRADALQRSARSTSRLVSSRAHDWTSFSVFESISWIFWFVLSGQVKWRCPNSDMLVLVLTSPAFLRNERGGLLRSSFVECGIHFNLDDLDSKNWCLVIRAHYLHISREERASLFKASRFDLAQKGRRYKLRLWFWLVQISYVCTM